MRYFSYNPYWKDFKRVEKVLSEKPETWDKYEHIEGGKKKILEMEIAEYRELEDKKSTSKERYKALKHIASSAILLMATERATDDRL